MPYSSTMTTATMTSAGSMGLQARRTNVSMEDRVEDAIIKMKSNLSRYTRSNDRRMIMRSLKDVKSLACLAMDPVQPSSIADAKDLEYEVGQENVTLNGIPFKPVGFTADGKVRKSESSNSFIAMLQGLCEQLCKTTGNTVDHNVIYNELILRMARTATSADAYFRLNSLMGSPDLLVMPVTSTKAQGNAITNGGNGTAPLSAPPSSTDTAAAVDPIQLNLYVANGNIHMNLSQTYAFGLFRKADVKSGKPWIDVHGVVHERANLSNNQSVRQLSVKFPEL